MNHRMSPENTDLFVLLDPDARRYTRPMSTDLEDPPAPARERSDSRRDAQTVAAALALPRAKRVELAHKLLDSLDDHEDLEEPVEAHVLSPAWEAEIERRVKAYDAGQNETVPWADVKKSMQDTLKKHRRDR